MGYCKTKLRRCIVVFFTLVVVFSFLLPQAIQPAYAQNSDISAYVNFTNGQLTGPNSTTITDGDTDVIFINGSYEFTIDYAVNMGALNSALGQNGIEEGDYVTFKVPEAFAGVNFNIIGPDGNIWVTVQTDAKSTAVNGQVGGKMTFTSYAENQGNVNGGLNFYASFSEAIANIVQEWKFEFDGTYTYSGDTSGSTPTGPIWNGDNPNENVKYGNGNSGSIYTWTAYFNIDQDPWTGEIDVEDVLGSGHKMKAGFTSASSRFSYYGVANYDTPDYYGRAASDMGNYYFGIALVDWDTMRADYNAFVTWTLANKPGSTTLWADVDGTGTYTDTNYALNGTVTSGRNSYMQNVMRYWQIGGTYRYTVPYTGGLESVTVTDGGFTLKFPSGSMDRESVCIYYYTELTAIIPPTSLTNSITVSGTTVNETVTASNTVRGSGTIRGTEGKIMLYKYDSGEINQLAGAEFMLEESSISYSETQITGANGDATFSLSTSGYAGTYTLTEATPPAGYAPLDPISIIINANGEITDVNGTAIPVNATTIVYDANGDELCKVSADRLILIVYNQRMDTPVDVVIEGKKELAGRALAADEFDFVLKDSVGVEIETVQNQADKTFEFSALTFTSAGTYTYTVEEKGGTLGGVAYDSTVYDVTVTVVSNGSGALVATVIYEKNGSAVTDIEFKNTYTPASTTVILDATKKLTGKALEDGMFRFVVKDSNGVEVATGTNAADGRITFSDISCTTPGTDIYTVSEVNGGADGITYDNTIYTVSVEVVDNGDGTLTATPVYPSDGIVFNNSYSSGAQAVSATKTGDNTPVVLLSVLCVSFLTLSVVCLKMKRKGK